ncbi:MAG: glycerate kinase [Candidatus Dadabacteria bacterium]|nr:glycerate kinase [Candidatus Dadabacteria bacterium]
MNEKLRKDARTLFDRALREADPGKCVLEHLELRDEHLKVAGESFDLSEFESLYVIAFGKAASSMAAALEELLGDRITEGIVVSNVHAERAFQKMNFHLSSHPVPDEKSFRAAKEALSLLEKSGERDLVIFLISGGGSSILAMPSEGLTMQDIRAVTQKLMLSGVDTYGLNTVRKKMSQIKGGGLLKKALPSKVITLILSDVVGDRLEFIASGPTVPDTTTYEDAWRVIEALELEHKIPPRVVVHLERGRKGNTAPAMDSQLYEQSGATTVIVGNNHKAIISMEKTAEEMGYNTLFLSSQISGEAREVAKVLAGISFDIKRFGRPVRKPACILFGGETTVNVTGRGRGGRNTETALSFCFEIIGSSGIVGLFAGTDGIDGPTDAAGAICDGQSRLAARSMGISARDHLANNDSYSFFETLGDLVKTGSTGTNVMDVGVVLIGE